MIFFSVSVKFYFGCA